MLQLNLGTEQNGLSIHFWIMDGRMVRTQKTIQSAQAKHNQYGNKDKGERNK